MASAQRDPRYHQDYIARIRYSNALPPPPNPPKLLDIPNTGLSSGQYTGAGFASRLVREQPLNIEADAELGMPIDLIGLPGVFDGDEKGMLGRNYSMSIVRTSRLILWTVILALPNPPAPHPHDRPLLRPLSALGKASSMPSAVSFLRRTEYLTGASGGSRIEASASRDLIRSRNQNAQRPRRKPDMAKDNPVNIIRHIVKGFDLAYPQDAYKGPDTTTQIRGAEPTPAEREDWAKPRHPTKPDLKVLDSYPVLPDFDAVPEMGAYLVMKFQTNPVPSSERYDERLDVALLRPLESESAAGIQQGEDGMKAWDYRLFLPGSQAVAGVKRKFSVLDPDRDEDSLYTDEQDTDPDARCFRYEQVRAYETYQQAGQLNNEYGDTVALILNDGTDERLQKGAYYHPISARTFIRPRRTGVQRNGAAGEDEEDRIDIAEVTVREYTEEEQAVRLEKRAAYDAFVES